MLQANTYCIDHPEVLNKATYKIPVKTPKPGYVHEINCKNIGRAIVNMGGGRITKEDTIDNSVGIEVLKKIGDYVKKGDVLISGLITKNDEIKNKVSAKGNVYAEVWYKVSVNMPYYYNEVNYLGEKRYTLKLNILNKKIDLIPINQFKTSKESIIFMISNNILPISFSFVIDEKTMEIEEVYTVEEAIKEAERLSRNKIIKRLKPEEKIMYLFKLLLSLMLESFFFNFFFITSFISIV